jgi:hypothetical protein
MTDYQKQQNEQWFLQMVKLTKQYIWEDKQELYHFIDGKILPDSKRGYLEICKIVRTSFSNRYLLKP